MLLDHAIALTDARSCIAALADRARNIEASSAYEHALLELDLLHGDDVPALDTEGLTEDREILMAVTVAAIDQLTLYGVDPLGIELLHARLDDARALDEP